MKCLKTICFDRWYADYDIAKDVADALARLPGNHVLGLVVSAAGSWGVLYLCDANAPWLIEWHIVGAAAQDISQEIPQAWSDLASRGKLGGRAARLNRLRTRL